MIRIFKLKKNDLNPSGGKQIEYSISDVKDFFGFQADEVSVDFRYQPINTGDPLNGFRFASTFKLSPARGDYKCYGNGDGSINLKSFFLEKLQLNAEQNIEDSYALKKIGTTSYVMTYIPKGTSFGDVAKFFYSDNVEPSDYDGVQLKENTSVDGPLQQIYFGAPGTGKSHRIKQVCKEFEHYRITFHPDTDYASFVGSYKPVTHSEPVYTNMGDKAIPLINAETGKPVTTAKITYQYVYQAFLNAYIAAWKQHQKENPRPVFLIIEEINRGNCAQIFGDIFQLLDRNESGFSDYPIIADNDLKKELAREFESLGILNAEKINGIYDDDIIAKVKSGSHLLLPDNLYIWATMNTSDQSLFPIDSAFKRRWEWKYVKIADSGKSYRISINGNEYDWWEFVEAINSHIGTDTDQEDKKLGYFFAKAKKNDEGKYIISADTFLSKVIFFIYNDVYKDFGFDDDIFKDENGEVLTFANYFDQFGDTVPEKVERFIQNLGLRPLTVEEATDMDGDNPIPSTLKARVNGTKVWTITYAFYQILRAIARNYTFEELQLLVGEYVKREEPIMKTIASPATYEKEKRWYNYKPLSTKDGVTFVITNQWKKEYIPQLRALAKAENVSYEELPE